MTTKVTDKELMKWVKIIGKNMMVNLYCEGKIYLTQKQLDMVIEYGKKEENNKTYGRK